LGDQAQVTHGLRANSPA